MKLVLLKETESNEDYTIDVVFDRPGLSRGDTLGDGSYVVLYSAGKTDLAGYNYKIKPTSDVQLGRKFLPGHLFKVDGKYYPKEDEGSTAYDSKGNAAHYTVNRIDTFTVYERTFGTLACMLFCEMTAMKYRMRVGHKDQPIEQEIKKIKWYEKAARHYKNKLDTEDEIIINHNQEIDYISNYI